MTDAKDFSEVRRRLRPADVFTDPRHDWKKQTDSKWVGSCPWHDSDSGTCFKVFEPDELKWKCHSCGRGGGPLGYVAELESIGPGSRETLDGQAFFEAWQALADHAGCEEPPELDGDGTESRPLRNGKRKGQSPVPMGSGGDTLDPKLSEQGPDLNRSEGELRRALIRYREALNGSGRAQAYVEGRGLSVETLRAYGCGFAPAGEWIGSAGGPRIVTPHTTPSGELVNLDGRRVGKGGQRRHDRIGGNPTALFNASAIAERNGPLVFCEGPFDALSFIEAGHARTIALHNTDGVPWRAVRGNAGQLVFAFDDDETGREDAVKRAREAVRRGYEAHILSEGEGTYDGHSDPNDALRAGDLSMEYLEEITPPPEGQERAAEQGSAGAGQSPNTSSNPGHDPSAGHTAADLIPHWNGNTIGHLGRWIWERGGVPEGEVGAGLYADRELHVWVKEQLEAGPEGTSEQDRVRLRWVLWRLYAAHGPEEVPEAVIPTPPMSRR
ncbi:toprim domain-containing protein [Salinibacter ruber]|jgi:hypothetical protein|uniref:Toprim domain-containing protein n=1 Tax=Salinibacter ruber TaxID=146919 RepID=A0A9X2UQ11_9BACT|nr:toprim domain-containing protein [Salinibacter ruber]MCS3616695.1 hypothetical protein [Salinibacter ruber]MCS4038074.1 hypothetical protein [Salinibacter ruber]